MAARPDRPYSARSRLESSRPLNTSPPLSRLLTRSHSQSAEEARRYQSVTRAQALGDSARTHSSPSKTPNLRQQRSRPEAVLRSKDTSLGFATLLAVIFLLFWQSLVSVILCITLHSSTKIGTQIALQGAFRAVLPVDPDWSSALDDMRLSMNITSRGNSRIDVYELLSVNSTFARTTTVAIPGSQRSVSSFATGSWAVSQYNILTLNVTSCGGDTVFTCLNSNRVTSYSLTRKTNSFVTLAAADGSSLTYAYQPGLASH